MLPDCFSVGGAEQAARSRPSRAGPRGQAAWPCQIQVRAEPPPDRRGLLAFCPAAEPQSRMHDAWLSRRQFLGCGAAVLAGASVACRSEAAQQAATAPRRILLKGGCVLSLDPKVGDFDVADVL